MRFSFLFVFLAALLPLAAQDASTPTPAPAPLPTASADAPVDVMTPAAPPAPAESPDASAPASPDEPVAKAVRVPPPRKHFDLPQPANPADVTEYIGHRYYEDTIDSGGWGWVKLPSQSWKRARWVTVRETPGITPAPYRALGSHTADQNYEYKMHGFFAPYQVYDPHTDEMLDVFVLLSYEPIGPAQPLSNRTGPDSRRGRARSTFSSRSAGV